MVSRKSTKKTYWVLFFAIAVVILLGLFFYFYSGVYEGVSTKAPVNPDCSKIFNLLNSSFYKDLSQTEKYNIENYLNNLNSAGCTSTRQIVNNMNSDQKEAIKNFANQFTSTSHANNQFNLIKSCINNSNLNNSLNNLKKNINLTITPAPPKNYRQLFKDFITKNLGLSITKFNTKFDLDDTSLQNKFTDSDYKNFYIQLMYFLQYMTWLSTSGDFNNFLTQTNVSSQNNIQSQLFYLLLIQANS